jgi:VIT1/CCC1 family predicted Fe2+/Mn2+ transporter
VSSQADAEHADVEREKHELATQEEAEKRELAKIYVERGLTRDLAQQVAEQLMAHDALGAHARDELGISEMTVARPIQAALASAGTFAVGAALPLGVAAVASSVVVAGASLLCLGGLGALAAQAGGASIPKGAVRVLVWGALAMAATAGIGRLFGAAVS